MIIIEFKKDKNFLDVVRRKVKRFSYRIGSPIAIYISEDKIIIKAPEMGLDIALIYSIYLEARDKGLDPRIYYAVSVDPDELIPEDIRKLGNNWRTRKLRIEEINKYKTKILTGELLDKLEKAKLIKLFSS